MPMRVKVNGIVGEVIEPCGKFNYGDIVEIIKIKISKFDFFKSRVCVSDGQTVYWMNMKNIKLMPAEDCSI